MSRLSVLLVGLLSLVAVSAQASIIYPVDSRLRTEIKNLILKEITARCPITMKEHNFFAVKIDAEVDESESFYVVSLVGINATGDIVNNMKIGIEEWSDGYEITEFGAAQCK